MLLFSTMIVYLLCHYVHVLVTIVLTVIGCPNSYIKFFLQEIFDNLANNVIMYNLSSYFRGIPYKQSQLSYKINICLSDSHSIITNMHDVFHMFFLQNL